MRLTANWRKLVGSLLAVTILVITPGCRAPVDRSWSVGSNVVLIIIDTLRADYLGSYGFELDTSPELDALAERGVRFENVIAPSSWTRPSHGSLFTGHYPRTLGLYREKGERLAEEFATLAEVFQDNGYFTVGATANPTLNEVFGFGQGFDHYLDSKKSWGWMGDSSGKKPEFVKFSSATDLFDQTFEVIESGPNKPFYLQLNVMEVHNPGPRLRAESKRQFASIEDPRSRRYLRATRQISKDIDAFVERLTALDGGEDVLVIITSDHGEGLTSHPDVGSGAFHGSLLYESHLRVPLIFFDSGDRIGRSVIEQPVRLLDVMPTLLEVVGLPVPVGMAGRSLARAFKNPLVDLDLPDYFVAETEFKKAEKIALYGSDWKYIENRDGWSGVNPRELQAIGVAENGKSTDRIDAHREIADSMSRYLMSWESSHPRVEVTSSDQSAREQQAEEEQLRALGYLE